MTDGINQIAALYQRWGGDADSDWGESPQEQTEKYKHKRLPFMPPCEVVPLNPYRYEDVWRLSEEAAASLNTKQPTLYQIVAYTKDIVMPIGYYPPDRLFLDLELCHWLNREELQGLLGHEMRHSQQSTIHMLIRRNVGLFSHALAQADKGLMSALAGQLAQHCVQRAGMMEFDADSGGASLVGPEVMQRAILKLALFVIAKTRPHARLALTDLDHEDAGHMIDTILDANHSFKRQLYAGTTIAARIEHLDRHITEQATEETQQPDLKKNLIAR